MHTASDVFVILKAGGRAWIAVTKDVAVDHRSVPDSVRGTSEWAESLVDSQINLICALFETASLADAPGRSHGR
jgi:hypothetical protein